MNTLQKVRTITEFHRTRTLPPPEHSLISVIDYADVSILPEFRDDSWVFDFYFIALKRDFGGKILYGQQTYDFDEGVMFFMSPGQVFSIQRDYKAFADKSGWMLLIHPDFFWNTPLAKSIRKYEFFDYSIREALFVSKKEENTMMGIIDHIRQECHANIDKFSQQIIVSQIETLLSYSERFYNRQFLTRKKANHNILDGLEALLTTYFNDDQLLMKGLPTVQYISERLNVSPKYLSSLLKVLTGLTAQQHIHEKLIAKAKEKLSTTDLSVGEIAFELGFEHPQSFSKFFKAKTELSPLAFRQSFP